MYKTIISLTLAILIYTNCLGSGFLKSEEKDNCATAAELQKTIMRFINYNDKTIYEKEFLASFSQNNENQDCYFPTTEKQKEIYYFLGDSSLVQHLNKDERAMALLIDLYLLNQNNAELTEYYGSKAIPKAVMRDTEAFVKVLSGKTESEVNTCISSLQNIEQNNQGKLLNEITALSNEEYLPVVNKIKEVLK